MRHLRLTTLIIIIVLMALTGVAAAEVVCQYGDSGSNVRVVQSRLYSLGFIGAEPASPYKYDAETKKGVSKFQTGSAINSTGIVDDATFAAIKLSSAVDFEGYLDVINKLGASGEEVKSTKARLKKLGYFSGNLTVKYNAATKAAVTTFQAANSLAQTGAADKATRKILFGTSAVSYSEYKQSAATVGLKKGDKGGAVTKLQSSLKSLGYFSDTASGYYNAKTVVAVKLFETCNGLAGDGVADETMLKLLYSGSAKSYDDYISSLGYQMVKLGDQGDSVTILQKRLTELYYYDGKISGVFNQTVQASVKRFQNGNGVNAEGTANHGVATVATRKVMNSDSAIDRIEAEGLLVGDSMAEVSKMTARLKSLGYLSTAYVKYNSYVKAAVAAFQSANKIKSTGLADPVTLETIYSDDAVTYSESQRSSSSTKIEKMIDIAYKYLGSPYRSPCSVPNSFDCSNYTRFVVRKMGITIPAEVTAQGRSVAKRFTKITDISSLKRGDLVYFDTQTDKPIGHAVIYLGVVNGQKSFIHASSSAGKVLVTVLSTWYKDRFLFGARIWE